MEGERRGMVMGARARVAERVQSPIAASFFCLRDKMRDASAGKRSLPAGRGRTRRRRLGTHTD